MRNLTTGTAFSVFILWSIGSLKGLWLPSHRLFVLPFDPELLGLVSKAFGGYRVVIDSSWMEVSLIGLSFLGPLALVGVFFTAFWFFSGPRALKLIIALACVAACYSYGAPGENPQWILELIYVALLIGVFLKGFSKPIQLWILCAISLSISLFLSIHSFTLYWLVVSATLGSFIHFLLVDRLHIPVAKRLMGRKISFQLLGLLFLFSAIILSTLNTAEFVDRFQASSQTGWVLLGVLLAVVLTTLSPWESFRWIRIAIASLGSLLSYEFELPSILICLWLIVELVLMLSRNLRISERILEVPTSLLRFSYFMGVFLFFLFMLFQVVRFEPDRKLKAVWGDALKFAVEEYPKDGVLLYGNALELFSLFHAGTVAQNAPLILETSEKSLYEWLANRNIQHIIIHRESMQTYWRSFIRQGVDPLKLNQSVLSRLLLYDGDEVDTQTLQLEPVSLFEILPLDSPQMLWVKRKDRSGESN